jgi:hypothetical protein
MKHFNHDNVRKVIASWCAFVALLSILPVLGQRDVLSVVNLGIWVALFCFCAGFFDKTPPEFIARATMREAYQKMLDGDSTDWDALMAELMAGVKQSFLAEIWKNETSNPSGPADKRTDRAA